MSAPPPGPPSTGNDNANPPASPRSPRPAPPLSAGGPGSLLVPPELQLQPPPRPNISSMLFLASFFFFMSGNHYPPPSSVEVGEDGELIPRLSELEFQRGVRDEWAGWLNGTREGNYTEPSFPDILASDLIPPEYVHTAHSTPYHHDSRFFTNITGFYRSATVHPLSLSPSSSPSTDGYWRHVTQLPSLNSSGEWNETLAEEMRGSWAWAKTVRWDMNLKERNVSLPSESVLSAHRENGTEVERYEEWAWVKGSVMLTSSTGEEKETIDYDFYGLHHIPNGTYNLYGLPEGMRVDIRRLPGLWGKNLSRGENEEVAEDKVARETREIVLRELEKEVRAQEEMLLLNDLRDDDISDVTTCPLIIHFTLPPLPHGLTQDEQKAYEAEVQNPTGILSSLARPPAYWQTGVGLGGVIVADGCGWAMGVEGGKGMAFEDFWNRSVNYALYASLSQLVVLLLLVRQMEAARTPSALAKVSLYTIVIMAITDSWIFSAHVVVGIVSDTRASLPMLIPGFMCLCTAVIFGPRYAVLLHRVQAPERSAPNPTPAAGPAGTAPASGAVEGEAEHGGAGRRGPVALLSAGYERVGSVMSRVGGFFGDHPGFKWLTLIGTAFCFIQFAFLPSVLPVFITVLYSFWVPQILRNARRGTTASAMDAWFVLGTTAGRLALPLYAFAYSENVFFVEKANWVWVIVYWQLVQVAVLFAQDRFGPAFFLPKSLAPPESYNYHPLLPTQDEDPEASHPLLLSEGEKTCSICMEEVDLSQSHPASRSKSGAGLSSLGVGAVTDKRKSYALAPCGHLFHTKCLAQWTAIKTICPLCKRSLPPL